MFMIDDVSHTAAQVKQCNPSRVYKGERGDGRERAEQRRRSRDWFKTSELRRDLDSIRIAIDSTRTITTGHASIEARMTKH